MIILFNLRRNRRSEDMRRREHCSPMLSARRERHKYPVQPHRPPCFPCKTTACAPDASLHFVEYQQHPVIAEATQRAIEITFRHTHAARHRLNSAQHHSGDPHLPMLRLNRNSPNSANRMTGNIRRPSSRYIQRRADCISRAPVKAARKADLFSAGRKPRVASRSRSLPGSQLQKKAFASAAAGARRKALWWLRRAHANRRGSSSEHLRGLVLQTPRRRADDNAWSLLRPP